MRARVLLRLYPPAWQARYGEEFLAAIGPGPLPFPVVIDIVRGAADAWLSADVRRAAVGSRAVAAPGGFTMMKALCRLEKRSPASTRDALIGAGVMIGASLLFMLIGIEARRLGWTTAGRVVADAAFPVAMMVSMPFWLMKGTPRWMQISIVGGSIVVLAALAVLGVLI